MKAVCIVGSPRAKGSTSMIVDKVIEGMQVNHINSVKFCLGDVQINYCLGCKNCYLAGKCVQYDDMANIMDKLIEADLVLIASPSYWGDVTGQLKVFFDRSTPYGDTNKHRTIISQGKKGIAIAIRAGKTKRENVHIIESIEHYFGHLGIEPIAQLTVEGVDEVADLINRSDGLERAYGLGLSVIDYL